jgi:hypothetical protein
MDSLLAEASIQPGDSAKYYADYLVDALDVHLIKASFFFNLRSCFLHSALYLSVSFSML